MGRVMWGQEEEEVEAPTFLFFILKQGARGLLQRLPTASRLEAIGAIFLPPKMFAINGNQIGLTAETAELKPSFLAPLG